MSLICIVFAEASIDQKKAEVETSKSVTLQLTDLEKLVAQKPLSDISGARVGLQSALMKLLKGITTIESIAQKDLVSVYQGRVEALKAVLTEGVAKIFADDWKSLSMSLGQCMKELMSKPATDLTTNDMQTWGSGIDKLKDALPTAADLGRNLNV